MPKYKVTCNDGRSVYMLDDNPQGLNVYSAIGSLDMGTGASCSPHTIERVHEDGADESLPDLASLVNERDPVSK